MKTKSIKTTNKKSTKSVTDQLTTTINTNLPVLSVKVGGPTKSTFSNSLKRVSTRKLKSNTQRALLTLARRAGQWVPRTDLRMPSAGSRVRDLRTKDFGSFRIECTRKVATVKKRQSHQTYYRLIPTSGSKAQIQKVLGVKI